MKRRKRKFNKARDDRREVREGSSIWLERIEEKREGSSIWLERIEEK